MGLFSLDIEKIYKELSVKGEKILGMFCIQYPIYCIHTNILDSSIDSLDSLDQLIIDCLKIKSNYSQLQLAAILGTSKKLIEYRIDKLIVDNHLEKKENDFIITELGKEVFINKSLKRLHKKSYDFYLDGINLNPLSEDFYKFYKANFFSEYDIEYYTNNKGKTSINRPFAPDIVHTPITKETLVNKIIDIPELERESYAIPLGLVEIEDISFTKLSLPILINVTKSANEIKKELIDGFVFHAFDSENSYYDEARKNVLGFEKNCIERIKNLQFKIIIPKKGEEVDTDKKPLITSNWDEIDKYKESNQKCFIFSKEDLKEVVEKLYNLKNVEIENLINEESEIGINITKKMLFASNDRRAVISNLLRERDYAIVNTYKNVFMLYLYYKSTDTFVNKVIRFKKIIDEYTKHKKDFKTIVFFHPEYKYDFRECLIAAGELEVLESIDIFNHMILPN